MKRNALLALALAAAVGACTMDEDTPDQGRNPGTTSRQVDATDMEAMKGMAEDSGVPGQPSAYETATPNAPSAVPDLRGGMTVAGQLIPVNRSGVNGSLTVSQIPSGTLVSVSLTDAQANTAYRVAINQGRCGSTGREVAPVGSGLQVGSTGSGAVTDTLTLPAATVMNGQHVVTVNGANAGPSTPPVACADIPANRPNPESPS
ncbi:MAG: hypothetical protein AB1941_17530 [Gemmatimonadota bacterium]